MFSTSEDVPVLLMVTVTGELAEPTGWLPKDTGLGEIPMIGETPVPVKESVALTVPLMVRTADMAPVAGGVKVTLTVHDPLAAMLPPLTQVPPPVFEKAEGLAPVIVKYGVDKTSAAVPVFDTVMVVEALVVKTFWLPNAAGLGEKLKIGTAGATPVPVSGTLFGLVGALVVKVRLALLATAVVGEKTTLMVQDALATRVPEQVLPLVENSAAFAPVSAIEEMLSVVFPVLVSVTARLPLEVPVV